MFAHLPDEGCAHQTHECARLRMPHSMARQNFQIYALGAVRGQRCDCARHHAGLAITPTPSEKTALHHLDNVATLRALWPETWHPRNCSTRE